MIYFLETRNIALGFLRTGTLRWTAFKYRSDTNSIHRSFVAVNPKLLAGIENFSRTDAAKSLDDLHVVVSDCISQFPRVGPSKTLIGLLWTRNVCISS